MLFFPRRSSFRLYHTLFRSLGPAVLLAGWSACREEPPALGTGRILEFRLDSIPALNTTLDSARFEIRLTVPARTVLKEVRPLIRVSEGAGIVPASRAVRNFSRPVLYTVTGPDGNRVIYRVIVIPEDPPEPENLTIEQDTVEAGFPVRMRGRHFGDFPLNIRADLNNPADESTPVPVQWVDSTRLDLKIPVSVPPGRYRVRISVGRQSAFCPDYLQVTVPAPRLVRLFHQNLLPGDSLSVEAVLGDRTNPRFSLVLEGNGKKWNVTAASLRAGGLVGKLPDALLPGVYSVAVRNESGRKESRETGFRLRIYDRALPFIDRSIRAEGFFREGRRLIFPMVRFKSFPARFFQVHLIGAKRSYVLNGIYLADRNELTAQLPAELATGLYEVALVLAPDQNQPAYRIDLDAQFDYHR
ncbi:hypothetical protein [Larkinella soli]|uniref:hypothetical protein n=1 Tax=Larkinella soli TaxID=1770527 RepID=UPI000FFC7FAC|nr:hypothetical protein [Larkinella soli]